MEKNKRRMSLREGGVFIDGIKVIDADKVSVVFKPEVGKSRALGERSSSRRWLGYDIAVTLEKYKSNKWLKEKAREYIKNGKTPECTIQGIQNDKDSDFYDEFGSDTVTCYGCVLEGDISLMELDTGGEYVKEAVSFGAVDVD